MRGLKRIALFFEQVECYLNLVGKFTWRMARTKQNQRRKTEGRPDLQRFYEIEQAEEVKEK